MDYFDLLPNEIIRKILNNLNLEDLLVCFDVSRRFRSICEIVQINEIILANENNEKLREIRFHSNESIEYRYQSINFRKYINLDENFLFRKERIKYIHFFAQELSVDTDLSIFNGYSNLYQLDINGLIKLSKNQLIRAPNLEIIKFCKIFNSNRTIDLICPKLRILSCVDLRPIIIHYPQMMRKLKVVNYSTKIELMINLEILHCEQGQKLNREILTILTNLKQLHLYSNFNYHHLIYIIKQRLILRKIDLLIYLIGVRLNSTSQIDEMKKDKQFTFQMNNYNQLSDDLTFFSSISYTHLIKLCNSKIPSDFLTKFFYIKSISANDKIENRKHFIEFIQNLPFLASLQLSDPSLDSKFFNDLTVIVNRLNFLIIVRLDKFSNMDFIFKFKNLLYFRTDIQSSIILSLAPRSFMKLKKLRFFRFKFDDEYLLVKRSTLSKDKKFSIMKSVRFMNEYVHLIVYDDLTIEQLAYECNGLKYLYDKEGPLTRSRSKLINAVAEG